jgi:hypothetical protein
MGSFEIRDRTEPGDAEDRRRRGSYRGLQEWQRAGMTQQTAVIRRMVRFLLRYQGKRLSPEGQAHEQQYE